jgi:hypothetical protein
MFPVITFTCSRSAAINAFQRFRQRGQLAFLMAKLTGKLPTLQEFGCYADRLQGSRKYLGLQTIPVPGIVGSVGRSHDFDRRFRPLKTHLRERWAGALLRSGTDSWPPINVNKVGEDYFVEDGHHRVSVANYLGMVYIQAEVWEYPPQSGQMETCQPAARTHFKRQAEVATAHG